MNKLFKSYSITIAILVLSSCSKDLFISESYQIAIQTTLESFSKKESIFTRQLVNSIPYASALISFGNKESLVILESKNNSRLAWVSADKKVFFTRNGRVISTIGLPNNLYNIEFPSLNFRDIIKEEKLTYVVYYSFKNPELANIEVNVEATVIGIVKVDLLGYKKDLILIEEDFYSKKINWRSKNKFWLDPESLIVWKSEQNLSPRLPVLKMEITRSPAN